MKRSLISIVCCALTLLACKEGSKEVDRIQSEEEAEGIFISKAQFQQAGLELGTPVEHYFVEEILAKGTIDVPPQNRAVISPVMGGFVKSSPKLVGDKVQKGQALLTLENPEYLKIQQEYAETHEQLAFLRSEYERQTRLRAEQVTSEKNYLKAESEYKKTLATAQALEKQLKLLRISPEEVRQGKISPTITLYAPIGGSVSAVNAVQGSFVSPGSEILEIIDNDHIHLELSVFEKDVLKLKEGQIIQFSLPESSGKTFTGKVYLIGKSLGKNRTVKVHGHIDEEGEHRFLTGMFVEARILVGEQNTAPSLALPESSIVESENQYSILVLQEETQEGYVFGLLRVDPGKTSNGLTEVLQELLKADSRVLIKGAFQVMVAE